MQAHLYQRLAEGLLLMERPNLHEVYVVSMYIDFDEGPHHLKVWLYYNTYSHLQRMIEEGEPQDEAKWNFALWVQDYITAVGLSAQECPALADQEWRSLLADWLREEQLYRSDAEIAAMLAEHDSEAYEDWSEAVRERLLDLLIEVATEIQESGIILATFGRAIPLLVHEWEYNPWTLEATRSANPAGLVAEFAEWLMSDLNPPR